MLKPDPAACCPDAYYCTAADITVCPRRHHTLPCCTGRGHHTTIDRGAWHRAQEVIEERLLHRAFLAACDVGHVVTPALTLGEVLDAVLGVVSASTLGDVHGAVLEPVV